MNSKDVVIATININGLPSFYHMRGAEEVLESYPLRHEEICKCFEKSNVDIINFQEVFTYRNLWLLKKNLPSYNYVNFKVLTYMTNQVILMIAYHKLFIYNCQTICEWTSRFYQGIIESSISVIYS